MIQLIHCERCGKSGIFSVRIEIDYQHRKCPTCAHDDKQSYSYHFCDTKCFDDWIRKMIQPDSQLRFPCYSCGTTGFAFTFEENGPCQQCEGRGGI